MPTMTVRLETRHRTLRALGVALEARGLEPPGHADRVSSVAVQVALELGLSHDEVEAVRLGAYLHDIGMLEVPSDILTKSVALSDDEWRWIRTHPDLGVQLASNLELPRLSLDVIGAHHERWDGAGYPRGARGLEIPLGGRLFAVVDAFVAMTTKRPGGRAISPTAALLELCLGRGTAYDPRIVDALCRAKRFVAPPLSVSADADANDLTPRAASEARARSHFALVDSAGRMLYTSPACHPSSELIWRDVHPDDRPAFLSAMQDVRRVQRSSLSLRWRDANLEWSTRTAQLTFIADATSAAQGLILLWLEEPSAITHSAAALPSSLLSLAMNSSTVMLLTDHEERIVDASPAFLRTTGYTLPEVIGKTPRLLQGPKTDRIALDVLRRGIDAGVPCQTELVNYAKDGRAFWVQISIDPIRDASGRIAYFLAIQNDITELKDRQQDDQRLLDVAQDFIVVTDAHGRVERTNLSASNALQSAERALQRPIWEQLGADNLEGVTRALEQLRTNRQPLQLETQRGARVHAWNVTPHLSDGRLYWVGRDVTQERDTARAWKLERDFVSSVLDNASSLVVVLDESGCILRFNAAAEAVTGLRFAEVRGQPLHKILELDASTTRRFETLRRNSSQPRQRAVLPWRGADGGQRFIAWGASALEDSSERFVVMTGQDITERIQNETRYRELFRAAEQQRQQVELLLRIADSVARELDLPGLARALVSAITQTLGFEHVSVYLQREDALHLEAQHGYVNAPRQLELSRNAAISSVVQSMQAVWLPTVSAKAGHHLVNAEARSAMAIPLSFSGTAMGVLIVESSKETLDEEAYALLGSVTQQLDLALERIALYGEARAKERQYRALVDNINDALVQIGRHERVTFVNPAWTRITGYGFAEMLEAQKSLFFVDVSHRRALLESTRSLVELRDSSAVVEFRCVTKSGALRWLKASSRIRYDQDGFESVTALVTDITESRRERVTRHLLQGESRFYDADDLRAALNALLEFLGGNSARIVWSDGSRIESDVLEDEPLNEARAARKSRTIRFELPESGAGDGRAAQLEVEFAKFDARLEPLLLLRDFAPGFARAVERAEAHRDLLEAERTSREFIEATLRAQEQERERIAIDLHDGPAQTLVSALRFVESGLEAGDKAHTYAERGVGLIRTAIKQVRDTISDLIPPDLEILGLRETMRQRLEDIAREEGWQVELDVERLPWRSEVTITLYRIFVEALNNVRRHANASTVRCALRRADGYAILEVNDDGVGFDPLQTKRSSVGGVGTVSMHKRAEFVGGRLQILSQPGAGTTVRVTVPLPASPERKPHV
jgi:PAS domain S-box-containing protein